MSGKLSKAFKWGASALRVARVRIAAGSRLRVAAGKPLYLGKGVRVILGKGASFSIGSGVYLSPGCVVQVDDDENLVMEDRVYMNECCRVTVVESVCIGADTIFGPNVQIYDHDHDFNRGGFARDYSMLRLISENVAGCVQILLLRAAAQSRIDRSFQQTPLSRTTPLKEARCMPVPLLG